MADKGMRQMNKKKKVPSFVTLFDFFWKVCGRRCFSR